MINPAIFKAYDIRGVYPDDINEEAGYAIGRAFVTFLKVDGGFSTMGQGLQGLIQNLAGIVIIRLSSLGNQKDLHHVSGVEHPLASGEINDERI